MYLCHQPLGGFIIIFITLLLSVGSESSSNCNPHTPGCSCGKGTMICTNSSLTYFPQQDDPTITDFKFINCGLVDVNVVPYDNAMSLLISGSGVRRIQDGAFSNLTQLQKLTISQNALESLSKQTFSGLGELKTLNLIGNKLTDLPNDLFDELENLEALDLSMNHLNLTHELSTQSLAHIEEVKCEECGLTSIPSEVFTKLTSLQRLYLNANSFKALPADIFKTLGDLQLLSLDGCHIETISDKAFTGLPHLNHLDLGYNQLKELPQGSLKPFFNSLKVLYLENNQFQMMIEDRAPWANLTEIRLGNNPWTCDCMIAWMKDYDLKNIDKENVTCAAPESLKGVNLFQAEANIVCSSTSHSAIVFAITIPIIILCFAILIYYIKKLIRQRRRREQQRQSFQYRSVYGDTVESSSTQNILA